MLSWTKIFDISDHAQVPVVILNQKRTKHKFIFSLRIRPGEEIVRNFVQAKGQTSNSPTKTRGQALAKFAHAVIFVLKADDPRLIDYKDTLKKIRNHFREDGKCSGCFSIITMGYLIQ